MHESLVSEDDYTKVKKKKEKKEGGEGKKRNYERERERENGERWKRAWRCTERSDRQRGDIVDKRDVGECRRRRGTRRGGKVPPPKTN